MASPTTENTLLTPDQMDNQPRCETMVDVARSELTDLIANKILDNPNKKAYFMNLVSSWADHPDQPLAIDDQSFIQWLLMREDDLQRVNALINKIKFKITDTKTEAEYAAFVHPLKGKNRSLDAKKLLDAMLSVTAPDSLESTSSSIPWRDLLPEDDSLRSRIDADPTLQERATSVGLEIREASGQTWYNFTNLPSRPNQNLAFMTKDLQLWNREQAKNSCAIVRGTLPDDIDRSDKEKYPSDQDNTLYPEESDYDAIIDTLPDDDVQEKGILFGMLMGMLGPYWTNTIYAAPTGHVRRSFSSDKRSRDHSHAAYDGACVRAIRRNLS